MTAVGKCLYSLRQSKVSAYPAGSSGETPAHLHFETTIVLSDHLKRCALSLVGAYDDTTASSWFSHM
ncbi:hypothetical protein HBI56_216100 [Parastagonospora nodorum]|nr:hypothetical protein HBH53_240120 [Parastagonospora nodorum]KAH3971436.1 hypothetical protein HBH51_109170 [Parastagonospora nodorum]KAH4007760.1 hypothetical protein HBI10_010540 [Parastagonospora nodorum]KAH4008382.1 hypothetical protein HBI13_237200 [Parastagonospora nodorum]KAH4041417.1 hypothetical protein HBI09_022370 [Parastagonospora nodorum]